MSATTPCPAIADLRAFLNGELAAEIQAKIAQHIDGCSSCQEGLERMAAGKDSWADAAQHLAKSPAAADPLLQGIMNRLQAEPIAATTAESARLDLGSLDFLDPAEKPGQLGRLAHYEILEVIGHGGMGIVLKAYDTKLQRICAIKVMMPELAARGTARQRFIREARAAAAITHEHVVTIYAVEEGHSPPYLVMQYIGGRSLQQRIDECGAFDLKEILRIGMQAASGLAAAHAQGLVHRDIKPANILLENGVERVKITDFGLARAVDDARVTQSGVVTGTPQYMAPEQARGESVDHRADLFSLGGVMYAMCTGYAPFRASSSMAVLKKVCDERPRPIRDLNSEIPDWLVAIVEKLMAKDAKNRFQSASELAKLLGEHLAHLQQPAVFPTPPEIARPIEVLPATKPTSASLKLPILLMIAPFVLTPILLLAAFVFLDVVPWFVLMIAALAGGICFFAGVVLLIMRLASGRSYGGVAIVLVLVLLFVVCPVPILGLLGVFLFGWTTVRTSGPSNPTVTMTEEIPSSDDGRTVEEKNRATVDAHKLREIGKAMHRFGVGDNASLIDGLNWFPEESTACASYSFPAAPAELSDALWSYLKSLSVARVAANQPASPISEICDSIGDGSIMRVSYAMVDDPAGIRNRHFLRVSGLWNRDRVIQSLIGKWKATRTDLPPIQEQKVTILRREDCAIAVIGSTDLVLARFEKKPSGPDGHESAIREMLACKESRQRSLRNGPLAKDVATAPQTAFLLIAGDPPEFLRRAIMNTIGVAPRRGTISVAEPGVEETRGTPVGVEPGTNLDIRVNFSMKNRGDAELLAKNALDWPQQIPRFLVDSLNRLESQHKAGSDQHRLAEVTKSKKQLQLESRVDLSRSTSGFEFLATLRVPPTVWRAAIQLVKANSHDSRSSSIPPAPVKLLKRFDPKVDNTITRQSNAYTVAEDDGGWRISKAKTRAGQEFGLHEAPPVNLFEIRQPDIAGSHVTMRALVKSEATDPANQACFALHLTGGKVFPGPSNEVFGPTRKGKTNWTPYEISFDCMPGFQPEALRIDAFIIWEGSIWIKDIQVLTTPLGLPTIPPTKPAKEIKLKSFNVMSDKPFQTEVGDQHVAIEDGAWRIDAAAESGPRSQLRLFELPKQDVKNSTIVLRFKMKTAKISEAAAAAVTLQVGRDVSAQFGENSGRVNGTTDWKAYELRCKCGDLQSADIIILAGVSRLTGTMWLKDIEVVKIPNP